MNDRTAVLIIDVQRCNFEQSPPVHNSGELLSEITALVTRARARGALIVYVQHCGPEGAIDQPGTRG